MSKIFVSDAGKKCMWFLFLLYGKHLFTDKSVHQQDLFTCHHRLFNIFTVEIIWAPLVALVMVFPQKLVYYKFEMNIGDKLFWKN